MTSSSSSLPEPGLFAPSNWAPRSASAHLAYRLGQEKLAKAPVVFCFEYQHSTWQAVNKESSDARAVWTGPASALWRVCSPNEWRSLCCQADSFDLSQLRLGLASVLRERVKYWGDFKKAWEAGALGASLVHSDLIGARYAPGFAYGVCLRFQSEPGADSERLRAVLMGAGGVFQEWVGLGQVEWSPFSENGLTQNGLSHLREPGPLAVMAQARCDRLWEARLIQSGISGPTLPDAAKRIIRI